MRDLNLAVRLDNFEPFGTIDFSGPGLTLIHLISIPITNTSVNPARSTSQAIFAGSDYTSQLWLFWVAPIAGAIVAGFIHKALFSKE